MYSRFVEFKDLSKDKRNEYQDFMNKTFKRNGFDTEPKIESITIGNESYPVDIITLVGGQEYYHNIRWADKENDRKLQGVKKDY